MTIIVERISRAFAVKFPKSDALLANFKSVFPSAKWDFTEKFWKVSLKTEERLNQWAAMAETLVSELEEAENAALTEKELAGLEAQIAKIRAEIAVAKKSAKHFEATKSAIGENKEKLAAVRAELSAARKAEEAKKQSAKEILESIVDLSAISAAHSKMNAVHGRFGGQNRFVYEKAQEVIDTEHDKLKKIGLTSRGLHTLYAFNFNRPDRGLPSDITFADICDLVKM